MTVEPLPDHLTSRGGDPALLGKELLHIIGEAIANQPRTLQKQIGPSEVGHECARRIGYKLLGYDTLNNSDQVAWKPFVGTCVHAGLEGIFDAHNIAYAQLLGSGQERWYVETKVNAGEINGETIDGHTDLYDRVTATALDWKIVGPAQLKKYSRYGPGQQYRVQGHSYGRGWVRRGLPVDTVMVVFLPRNGELHETVIWHEPYDERITEWGFQRAEGIDTACKTLGHAALAVLPTADAFCTRCPYFRAKSTDLTQGCPGHPGGRNDDTPEPPALTLSR